MAARRVLILSDCQAAINLIETAWRHERVGTFRQHTGGAVLEEICSIRRRLDIVVVMYVPGHRGVVANEYADAVAKAYTNDEVDGDITRRVAAAVRTRPCVYEEGEAPGLCMRTVYAAALRGAQNWAVRQMRSTATHGILAGADESNVWSEVVAHTGHARAPKRRGDKGQTGGA